MITSAPMAESAAHSPLPAAFERIKMASHDVEPFPPLQSNFGPKESRNGTLAKRRRKSSGLGAELPGDTNVPAFATMGNSPPTTPTETTVWLHANCLFPLRVF